MPLTDCPDCQGVELYITMPNTITDAQLRVEQADCDAAIRVGNRCPTCNRYPIYRAVRERDVPPKLMKTMKASGAKVTVAARDEGWWD